MLLCWTGRFAIVCMQSAVLTAVPDATDNVPACTDLAGPSLHGLLHKACSKQLGSWCLPDWLLVLQNIALPGMVNYFRAASLEERDHAEMLMDFQVGCLGLQLAELAAAAVWTRLLRCAGPARSWLSLAGSAAASCAGISPHFWAATCAGCLTAITACPCALPLHTCRTRL